MKKKTISKIENSKERKVMS